jgi:type IV pilus assembly protein PilY1
MKIKLFIIKVLLSLILITNNSFAKNLPPGSGVADVPANVLILLDKSGSMGARMISGMGFYYPMGMAAHNGKIYAGQLGSYGIKSIDHDTGKLNTSFGTKGSWRRPSGAHSNCTPYYPSTLTIDNGNLYVFSYYRRVAFRINLTTNKCDWYTTSTIYQRAMAVKDSKLWFVGGRNNITYMDLTRSTTQQTNYSVRNRGLTYTYAAAVSASGDYLLTHYNRYLYKTMLQSSGAPGNTYQSNYTNSRDRYIFELAAHPSDNTIFYAASYYAHQLLKFTVAAGNTARTTRQAVGSCCRGSWRLFYPRGVGIDTINNRVYIGGYYGHNVLSYDLNLAQVKEFGGSSGTRMTGAHEAIKAIVTDSSLTAGVNFGFGYWSSGGGRYSGWDNRRNQSSPCMRQYCIKARVNKDGAARTARVVGSVSPGGGTDAYAWAAMAWQYYNHPTGPLDKSLACQNSYVLVIGDGQWGNHGRAKNLVIQMLNKHKIKTFTVAYGGGIHGSGIRNFRDMAKAGGTNDVIIADTTADLKAQLKAAISQIIASKLSFTAPAVRADLTTGGSFYQAQFDYEQNKQWKGTLKRTKIDQNGVLYPNDKTNWSAADLLPAPDKRKIWTELSGADYKTDLNNFVEANDTEINSLFTLTGNNVPKYHNINESYTVNSTQYSNPKNTTRCKNAAGVRDDNEDDVKGLINFVRGKDYFDYDADCNLTETIHNPLGDIYHSEMIVVGAPNAETAFVGTNQEAYFRSIKGYDSWAASLAKRDEVVYVGANDGMLHAFDAKTGVEKWGFVPPFVAANMPTMVNVNLNRTSVGGSNAIYGVDGSPVSHDMYFKGPYDNAKRWHTILMIPYGRGGAGFSVLDVTEPNAPRHLYSIFNDTTKYRVHVMDHNANINSYDYIASSYPIASFQEAQLVTDNAELGEGTTKCDETGDNQCYQSKTWTIPVDGLGQNDIEVLMGGLTYRGRWSLRAPSSGTGTTIIFDRPHKYYGYDPQDDSKVSADIGIIIKPGAKALGVQTQPKYDYSTLGETWSAPRIMRIPNTGQGDKNIEDDIYVAVMGGGYGAQYSGLGSNLHIIDLENLQFPGQIHKVIQIDDLKGNNIINSTPGSPVLVTPDNARGISYSGGLVYLSDLEGKITKFNLTNMSDDGKGNAIKIFDKTTLFTAGSTSTNGRYMYHSMDATTGLTTNSLWLFAGTGDYERIGSTLAGTQNLMLGIADPDFPLYRNLTTAIKADDLTKCKNVTGDTTGAKCPEIIKDRGWYATLNNFQKVTAEPEVSNGLVYFPVYSPSSSVNKCSLGDAFICSMDDECGTNISSLLGKNTGPQKNADCKYVGQGVLTSIVSFGGKIFANIAGQSNQAVKDLVTLQGATADVNTYRSSWRYNY